MESLLWKKNDAVRSWLNNKWLCIPEVSIYSSPIASIHAIYLFFLEMGSCFETLKHFGEWGTQVELQTAATLFHKPLYVLTQSTNDKGDYDWIVYKPQFSKSISFPKETELNFLSIFNTILQHLEICHINGCHYDCVVDGNSQIPLQPPELSKRDIAKCK